MGGRGKSSTGVVRAGALPGRASNPDARTLGRLSAIVLGRRDAGTLDVRVLDRPQQIATERSPHMPLCSSVRPPLSRGPWQLRPESQHGDEVGVRRAHVGPIPEVHRRKVGICQELLG